MENRLLSVILDTDSYKLSHWKQYPPNTTRMFSYFESRGGKYPVTVFFGLQYYLKKYLTTPITMAEVNEAAEFAELHGCPFNYLGWETIVRVYGGLLPIKIRAVPEGMVIPTHNLLFSVESSVKDPDVFWVVSWIETMLVRVWYPTTIATNSWYARRKIMGYLNRTSDDPDGEINFKLHDFGSRGVTSQEQAMLGGAAHLVNFMGSDTIAGIWMANKYYDCDMAGFSIPAAEHSTMSMWGKENEVEAYRNMIKQYGHTPMFACVSDTWDIYNACSNLWGGELKDEVLKMNATLVVRPDSGKPIEHVVLKVVQALDEKFGTIMNEKGFKVLNRVRVIQGDGIDIDSLDLILMRLESFGYSATNIAFGSGGGLLQKDFNRDTQKFAFKCSWAEIDGKEIDVYKDPVTDKGKKSKKGYLDLVVMPSGKFQTTIGKPGEDYPDSILQTVFYNGNLVKEHTFNEVRDNARQAIID